MATDPRDSLHISNRPEVHFRGVEHRDVVEMNHRIGNSLQLTAVYLVMQAKELADDAGARSALHAAAARVAAIADLHRYLSAHADAPDIDLAMYLSDVCPRISRSTGVEVSFAGQPANISFRSAQQIAEIVTELAINAGKHADTNHGALRIDCQPEGHNTLRLILRDEGPGLPMGVAPGRSGGVGLAIVASVVKDLGGQVQVKSDRGTVFELTVPIH